MAAFLKKGGYIQAATPSGHENLSVSIEVDPNGHWRVLGEYQKVYIHNKPIAYEFVERSLQTHLLQPIITRIRNIHKYFGFMTLDFSRLEGQYQLTGVDPYLTEASSASYLVSYFFKDPDPLFLYCPFIVHPGVRDLELRTFFHFCRMQRISFDITQKSGSIFLFSDSLQSECLGLLSISSSRKDVFKKMVETLEFLQNKSQSRQARTLDYSMSEGLSLEEISHTIRVMSKRLCEKPRTSLPSLVPIT